MLDEGVWRYILVGWGWVDIFLWVYKDEWRHVLGGWGVSGGIFCVNGHFYGWVGMGEGTWRFIVSCWGWVVIFNGWVGVDGGGWRYILGGWGWVDIFYGWVGVSDNGWRYILAGWVWVWVSVGGWGWSLNLVSPIWKRHLHKTVYKLVYNCIN